MRSDRRILAYHKPRAVVVTRSDERGRKTVYDMLPDWVLKDGWVPVGRLDRDSRGLLLFVREGGLVQRLGAPGAFQKMYEVCIRGHVTAEHVRQFREGVPSPVGELRCVEVEILRTVGAKTILRVVLDEGKNRHIRRMFGALKDPLLGTPLKVLELKRTAFGSLKLDLLSGQWRFLTPQESEALLRLPNGHAS